MTETSPFSHMRRLHERGPRSRGLVVDRDGVALGPAIAFVRRTEAGYACLSPDTLMRLARTVFGAEARFEKLPRLLGAIARALAAGDLVKAQLLGLEMPMGELDDGQLAKLAAAADLIKVGFDPSQPRDEHGRWSSGSDGAASDTGDASDGAPIQIADASEGISDAGGILPVSDAPGSTPQKHNSIDASEIADPRKQPVKVLDDHGLEVLDQLGNPMQRPKDMPPSLFVDRGLAAAAALQNTPPDTSIDQITLDHIQFRQGGALDAQRVNGVVVDQYVDYATVGIGLYSAAAGVPLEQTLATENTYAALVHSRYIHGEEMDDTYTFLPKRNVGNTKIGYDLYNSGRIGPSQRQ